MTHIFRGTVIGLAKRVRVERAINTQCKVENEDGGVHDEEIYVTLDMFDSKRIGPCRCRRHLCCISTRMSWVDVEVLVNESLENVITRMVGLARVLGWTVGNNAPQESKLSSRLVKCEAANKPFMFSRSVVENFLFPPEAFRWRTANSGHEGPLDFHEGDTYTYMCALIHKYVHE